MGVAVSGVSVDMDMAGVVFSTGLLVDAHQLRLVEVHVLVEAGRHRVHHQGSDRRHHRHESGEGELPPWVLAEARRRQAAECVGEDVDESGCQYHPGGERLDHEEHVVLRPQHLESPPQNREAHSDGAGPKD